MKHLDSHKVDKIISEKFSSSFMNDTKWEKLITAIAEKMNEVYVNYKLIYDEKINFTSFDSAEIMPFFIEPIPYKAVEWIEFPKEFKIEQNKRSTRKYLIEQRQDLDAIEKIINEIGEFMIERGNDNIKLYAYR